MAVQLEAVNHGPQAARHTYILTWNGDGSDGADLDYAKAARDTFRGIPHEAAWPAGRRRGIEVGDRLFFLRLGAEPKGILGAGRAVTAVYEDTHHDPIRRGSGEAALYVRAEFDRILDPQTEPILSLVSLRRGRLARINWNTQVSGNSLDAVSAELERLWRAHLLEVDHPDSSGEELSDCDSEQREALIHHRRREGKLRKPKIEQVIRDKARLACEVPGCGFDFFDVYGEIGREFAHVHELSALGVHDGQSEPELSELAIVCANCHAMIHRRGANRSLRELIAVPLTARGQQGSE
jgi:hypothetical protein